jgi:RNA polymerase sigma-70 factor (ECF subfamily)
MTTTASVTELLARAGWLRGLARRLTSDREDADDLLQDTWLAAVELRGQATTTPASWIAAVIRSLFLKRRLSDQRRLRREVRAAEGAPAFASSPEELVANMQVERLLAEQVLALREPYRQVVLLRYYEGRSAAEIARQLGVPAGTVRWRLKTAIDELRLALDAAHDRRRSEWRRAFAPLLLAGNGRRPPAIPFLLAAATGVVAVLGLAVWLLRTADRPGAAAESRPPRAPTGTPALANATPAAPPPGATLQQCRQEVERGQREQATLEAQRRTWMPSHRLFAAEPAPNLPAKMELWPVFVRVLRGDLQELPEFELECRTWVCRVRMYDPDTRDARAALPRPSLDLVASLRGIHQQARARGGWSGPLPPGLPPQEALMIRLQTDGELRARTAGAAFLAPVPTYDPLSRRALMQREYFFKLADRSGKPVPDRTQTAMMEVPPAEVMPPADLEDCGRTAQSLGESLATLRAEVEALRPPGVRYQAASPNPALARELAGAIAAFWTTPPPAVDCRGSICKVAITSDTFELETLARAIRKQKPLPTRIDRLMSSDEAIYYFVAPTPRASGEALLRERLANLRATALPRCLGAHPSAGGNLRVRLVLPGTTPGLDTNDDGKTDEISVRYGGTAAASSRARCLTEALERLVVPGPLPTPRRGVTLEETFEL